MSESKEKQRQYLTRLRTSRAASFRSEVFPYFRYVVQSGFGLFVAAAVFTVIFGYGNLLRNVPENLQAGIIGTVLIACAAIWSPLRTYMRLADTVFLLPLESAVLQHYLRPARIAALVGGIARVLAAYVLFIPLYLKAPETLAMANDRPLWLLGLLLAAVAAWNAEGGWTERRTVRTAIRIAIRAARIVVTFLIAWALLTRPLLPALGLSVGCMALVALLWRAVPTVRLPWERLIQEESRTARRWRRFLSWFVDMPTEETRPARRRWAAWLADSLPWKREWAWHYWQAKTFARGETFGSWFKWMLVAGIILLIVDHETADWIGFTIGVAIGGIQLTELASIRFDVGMRTLPIGQDLRRKAAAAIARTAGMAGTALLWLLTALPQGMPGAWSWTSLALLAAGMAWNGWLIPRRIAKPLDED